MNNTQSESNWDELMNNLLTYDIRVAVSSIRKCHCVFHSIQELGALPV